MFNVASSIISAAGDVVSTTIKWSLISLTTVGTVTVIYTNKTKPSIESFKPFFKQWVENGNGKSDWSTKLLSMIANNVCTTVFEDYVFARLARVTMPDGEQLLFVGAADQWYLISK